MLEKRSVNRTPLQVNGKYECARDSKAESHQCILMDVSPAGAGLLVSSPLPVSRDMKLCVEFPVQSSVARACIDVKWARQLHEISNFNWAIGGRWSAIDTTDKYLLMAFAVENTGAASMQAEKLRNIL